MTITLDPGNLDFVRERFYNFYDGVVLSVNLNVGYPSKSCEITIRCQDQLSNSGWSQAVLRLSHVSEFRFEIRQYSFAVLSSGIQFAWHDKLLYVVLDAYPDEASDIPPLEENTAYVAGLSCAIETHPIGP